MNHYTEEGGFGFAQPKHFYQVNGLTQAKMISMLCSLCREMGIWGDGEDNPLPITNYQLPITYVLSQQILLQIKII